MLPQSFGKSKGWAERLPPPTRIPSMTRGQPWRRSGRRMLGFGWVVRLLRCRTFGANAARAIACSLR